MSAVAALWGFILFMYYITKKDSETGVKFTSLLAKIKEAKDAAMKEAESFGAKQWLNIPWYIQGGISGIILPNGTDNNALRLDKRSKHENVYTPNQRSNAGKILYNKWHELPKVSRKELNSIINIDAWPSHIGYNIGNEVYYAFKVNSEWDVSNIPADCEEITTTRYKELFPSKSK